ncbi:hypothetical protein PPYR_07431 [Photinus pyralis]|uniref:Aminotransferase class V domain-containing protein n=2 Tax=Photinus pyralis TaxID=7054 RepID=A0A5N4AQG5_PHOPY|nr:uncharacterized protein LOC116168248 isoform X1 [Photinus pyralis]KAB0799551.1 hypothetical protein PPYR_07431 [Photinus pyralis]
MTSTTTIRKSYGNRKLYTFPEDYPLRLVKPKSSSGSGSVPKKVEDVAKLLKYIDDNIVGKNNAFLGPFGRRKVVFCDYIASGRSLQFIEEYILREVLPCFGNTWSTTNITTIQTSLFRQEAREIIKNAVNASEEDAVIFTENGCVGAIQKMINSLDLIEPPIIFTAHNEDYDHLKLWQEAGATVIKIAETKEGFLDLHDLEDQLRLQCSSGRPLIGLFPVASNITGIIADDVATTLLLHQYGALSFWDYNFAAPSISIDLNPLVTGVKENSVRKDAIYFSVHKFVGGVQTPGVLIMRKSLFKDPDDLNAGFFDPYNRNICFEMYEERNATQVVESIRAGLVMQLKETMTSNIIMHRQDKITKQMMQHIRTIPEILLLGNKSQSLKRLPIFSFMVRHPRGTFLHHNFVCAVLNDIFGIQARAGCANSGSYTQDLLGIDQHLADQYENIILEDYNLHLSMHNSTLQLLRPGFTRISLPYFINDSELAFIMEAIKMVATEGWKLLPQYIVDLETGEWRHYSNSMSKDRKWLGSIRYVDGKMTMNERRISGPGLFPQNYSDCLQTARNLFNRARKTANRNPYPNQGIHFDIKGEQLRWFMLPQEAQELLTANSQNVKHNLPFDPMQYSGSKRQEKQSYSPISGLQTRHYSLSAIDDSRINGSLSPLPYYVPEQFAQAMEHPPHFAVGESVSSTIFHPLSNMYHRERCMSLGDSMLAAPFPPASPLLSPQTSSSLGIRRRNCSCSSQTDVHSLDSDLNISPAQSLNVLNATSVNDCSLLGRASPAQTADLRAYVSEISKELATSIKYEIREVINKVEDVLESELGNKTYYANERYGSGSEDGRSDSISANEVAEYLEKVSREMANEVKSEIRDVVSAVDVFITPEGQERHTFSRASSVGDSDRQNSSGSQKNLENSDAVSTKFSNGSYEEPDKVRTKLHASTVTSVSSQDSGINLSFQEPDSVGHEAAKKSAEQESRLAVPQNIWQPTIEAIEEYKMIRDGDKVMVCLSGRKDSLSLLHTLLRYQSYIQSKGIVFNLGAITIDPDSTGCDPCILIPHLKQLGVNYVVEEHTDSDLDLQPVQENYYSFSNPSKRRRLYSTAKSCGYNVLAVGQHLDDLCESFILSIFHTGKINSMNAHYLVRDHELRIIRPFIYVREKAIKQFVISHRLPVNLETNQFDSTTKQRLRAKQMLAQQEILYPKLYENIKSAMNTIMGFHLQIRDKAESAQPYASEGETDEESILREAV